MDCPGEVPLIAEAGEFIHYERWRGMAILIHCSARFGGGRGIKKFCPESGDDAADPPWGSRAPAFDDVVQQSYGRIHPNYDSSVIRKKCIYIYIYEISNRNTSKVQAETVTVLCRQPVRQIQYI